jgi:hypothetical protein
MKRISEGRLSASMEREINLIGKKMRVWLKITEDSKVFGFLDKYG